MNFVAFFILSVGFIFLDNPNSDEISFAQNTWFKTIVLLELVPQFCLMTRRLHDMNNDETLAYVMVALNVVNIVTLDYFSYGSPSALENTLGGIQFLTGLYILFGHGTKGDNKYGADPLENS